MIVSHAEAIEWLPDISAAWSFEGSFVGLKAKGSFTVNGKWKNGKVVSYRIRAVTATKVKVIVNRKSKQLSHQNCSKNGVTGIFIH